MIHNRLTLTICSLAVMAAATGAPTEHPAATAGEVTAEAFPTEHVWTFGECIDWATRNSTTMRQAMLSVLQAEQYVLSAKDQYLPTVSFGTTQSYSSLPFAQDGQKHNTYSSAYNITAGWTLWEGTQRKYKLNSAKLLQQQQELAGEDAVLTLKLGILQAYLNILYAREAIVIAEQTLEVSTAQTERSKKLLDAGKISKVDHAQIETQQAQDSYSLVQARNSYESALMALKKILQLDLNYRLEVADVSFDDSEVMALLPERGDVYLTAAGWLPEIRSNEISKDIYDNDVKAAKATALPTMTLNGSLGTGYTNRGEGWGSQMKHSFSPGIGLSISVPLFNANSTKRAVAKAKLARLEYDLNRKLLLDDLAQTIENLYIEAGNARARYTSGQTALNSAQLTSELADRQFELGLVNPLELLTAHNNLLTARLELLQSKYMAILSNKTINYYATQEMAL